MGATRPRVVEGVGAAIFARVVGECNLFLSQELIEEEGEVHADSARDAQAKEPYAWTHFEVNELFKETNNTKAVVNTRLVLTQKLMDGKKSVMARLAAKGN